MSHIAPTQVTNPWRATVRTIVQVGIPTIITLTTVVPAIIEIVLEELGETLPASVRAWLLGAGVLITAVAGVLARIMAIPAVNAWLGSLGLSATPKG